MINWLKKVTDTLVLGCVLVTFYLSYKGLKEELVLTRSSLGRLKGLSVQDLPTNIQIEDAFFDYKREYCAESEHLSLKLNFSANGNVAFTVDVKKTIEKSAIPVKGYYWTENSIFMEIWFKSQSSEVMKLTKILLDESNLILEFYLDDIEFNLINCKKV
jgi:hypothetical protein